MICIFGLMLKTKCPLNASFMLFPSYSDSINFYKKYITPVLQFKLDSQHILRLVEFD